MKEDRGAWETAEELLASIRENRKALAKLLKDADEALKKAHETFEELSQKEEALAEKEKRVQEDEERVLEERRMKQLDEARFHAFEDEIAALKRKTRRFFLRSRHC
ncbi:MAG: hypothetical protein J5973_08220 [Eubacterium sp.]|nr:hypothetical protein [Eubacterium sp.]